MSDEPDLKGDKMLAAYLIRNPLVIIPLLIQAVSYIKILKKMGRRPAMGMIPVLGEWEMSHDLFRHMRTFWRAAVITVCLFATALWLGDGEYAAILRLAAYIVYGIFLIRLYWRLAKRFGKKGGFSIGLILMPVILLPVLAFGKSVYLGPLEFKPEKERSRRSKALRKAAVGLLTAVELIVLVAGCFGLATILHPARPIAQLMISSDLQKMSAVTDSDEIIGREDTLGKDYEKTVRELRSREYFYPDHSKDEKVVVMAYVIGSDLEDDRGSATINIDQMKDATSKGDGVGFVVQAGGSDRWFTRGIEDSTVGRYLISGGELTEAQKLDDSMCMSEPENLRDFITWTKENYPADRYMLVLWDHGGGFVTGYGQDDLNKREDTEYGTMLASEIIGAVRDAGVKFDLIGFDACLMQNIEYAYALEPYADFYLASEETEPAYGWYYTAAFGKLAEDPALSTEEFGRMIVSSYDQLYRAFNDAEPRPENTLSLLDLTLIKPAYEQLTAILSGAANVIKDNPAVFANISAARSKAYEFYDGEQTDLISFLTALKKADYRQQVASDEELDRLIETIKACVVWRNKDSAEGINGLAADFPYSSIGMYSSEYEQLRAVDYAAEENFFNNFCSIMASQQSRQAEESGSFFSMLLAEDFSGEDWYIEGFEDYDTTDLFIDIPVKETDGAYLPELPEKTWDTILDVSTSAYMVTGDGLMYLGREYIDAGESQGHPLISLDDMWAAVNGHLACYETEEPLVTEEGTIYKGTIKARLNDSEDITIHVEWDPVKEDSAEEMQGHVTGYSRDDSRELFFMKKGLEQFEAGDKIEFMFDVYDEEGKLIDTIAYGKPLTVLSDERLTVKDEPLEEGTVLEYYGVLTDVYQRELMTEAIREKIDGSEGQ